MKIFQRSTRPQFDGKLLLTALPGSSPAAFLPLLALAALVGCASPKQALVLDPIGPEPRSASGSAAQGSLVVFSAFDTTADWNRSPYRRRFTDYQILSADGNHVVQLVQNNRETLLNNPPAVGLPAGSYRVVARANGYGTITAPVVIKPGQTTTVHLEGSVWWPRSSPIFASNPVRLPKGEIAGWRAEADTH
jgi:hypothetical protein